MKDEGEKLRVSAANLLKSQLDHDDHRGGYFQDAAFMAGGATGKAWRM
jgi:hypothetical protein